MTDANTEVTPEAEESVDVFSDDNMFDDSPAPAEDIKGDDPTPEPEEEPKDLGNEEPPSSEPATVPRAALEDERRKRQELQAKLKEFEKVEEIPDPVSDPQGYAKHLENSSESVALNSRIKLSRSIALDAYKDYEEMENLFMSLVSDGEGEEISIKDKALYEKFRTSDNPAKFAYDQAKKHQDIQTKTSPDYEKNLREKIEKELLAKYKNLSAADLPSLTTTAASDPNTNPPVVDNEEDDIWD